MGWISELNDVTTRNWKMRYLVYSILLVAFISLLGLAYIVLRDAFNGRAVKVGSLELKGTTAPGGNRIDTSANLGQSILRESPASKHPLKSEVKHTEKNVPESQTRINQNNKIGNNEANQNSGTNNGNIGGSNNKVHKVEGDNYGVNGDLNINKPIELTESRKNQILENIKNLQKDRNITSNYIILLTANNANNAGVFIKQLLDVLIENGYDVIPASSFKPFDGFSIFEDIYVDNKTPCIGIAVGNL